MSVKSSLILVCVLLCLKVAGTTYYIDPSGSNSNKGTSSSPWKTLSYACSKATVSGDIIHINAGSYTETAQSLLSAGVNIEGAGNTSIIHSALNGIYALVLSSTSQGTSGNQSISNIRMVGDMVAYGAILVDKRSNVAIHHCEFEDFFARGVMYAGSGFTSDAIPTIYATGNSFHDNIITNCADYQDGGKFGTALGNLEIGGQEGMLVYNNTITQEDRGTDDNGFCIKYCGNGYCKGVKIYNNTITKPSYDNSTWDFAIELWNSRGGIEIYNNRIQGGIDIGGNTSITNDLGGYGFAEKIYGNIIGFPSLQSVEENGIYVERGVTGGIYIYKNLIRNLTSAIVFYPGSNDVVEDIYAYSNVITGLGVAGQTNFGNSIDWSTMDGSTDVTFRNIYFLNNTIYGGTAGTPLSGLRFYFRGNATNISVKNNIIQGFKACPVYMETTGTITNVSIENNIFYGNGNSNQPQYSPEAPTNLTVQNNIISNPLFISLSDFHLQSSSPAIGKGMKIQNITTDFDGNTVNNPPGIGAYEYYPPVRPVYQNSSVENSTPSVLKMNYDLALKTVAPPATAFNVQVNSVRRTVSTTEIKGNAVQLTLASPVVYKDIVTVSYTAPSTNPIQTSLGGVAPDLVSKPVTNNCLDPAKPVVPPVVIINSPTNVYEGFISELDASSSYAPSNAPLMATWNIPYIVPVSAADSLKTKFLAPPVDKETPLTFQLNVSDAISKVSKVLTINVLPYKPSLIAAKISEIKASDFQLNYVPSNVTDSDLTSYWSSNGNNQWLLLKFAEPFNISFLELTFLTGQNIQTYFDILASKDNLTWDPVLTNVASCNFSGGKQVFDVPYSFNEKEYKYVKYVGHGNITDQWNRVSDIKIFGTPHPTEVPTITIKSKIVVFPNPAISTINISIMDQTIRPDKVRIIDQAGKILCEQELNPEDRSIKFPINLRSGIYLLALASGDIVLITQRIIVKA